MEIPMRSFTVSSDAYKANQEIAKQRSNQAIAAQALKREQKYLSLNQVVELFGLSHDEALTLCTLELFPAGERLGESCHLMFLSASIDVFVSELRQRGQLYGNVELALGRSLNI